MIRQVAIVSGKGGTGKTSLTAAFAQLAAPAVLVDADVDAADLHLVLAPHECERHDYFSLPVARIAAENCMLCMACAHVCRFDAISLFQGLRPYGSDDPTPGLCQSLVSSAAIRNHGGIGFADSMPPPLLGARPDAGHRGVSGQAVVDESVCEGCRACALICPVKAISFHPRCTGAWMVADTTVGPLVHARLHPGAEHAGKLTTAVRDRGRALAAERGLDLMLIDGPPGIGCAATAAIAGVDLAVAVTEPTPAAEADLERLWQRTEQLRIPLALIVNRCDRNPVLAERMLAAASVRGGYPLGSLPTDQAFRAAQRAGTSVLEVAGPTLREAIQRVWERLRAALDARTRCESDLPVPAERYVP
ncbi:MAG TPA: hypothetical protein DCS97_15240 [Planctomycetes bacterium]|nr:hypothetical protein [Planctomycetota bacterium]